VDYGANRKNFFGRATSLPADGEVQTKAATYAYDRLCEEISHRSFPADQKSRLRAFLNENREAILPLVIRITTVVDGEIRIELINNLAELEQNYRRLPPEQQKALKMIAEIFAFTRPRGN
jgi:hypothetical protein